MYQVPNKISIIGALLIYICCLGCNSGNRNGILDANGYLKVPLDSISGTIPVFNTFKTLGSGTTGIYEVSTAGQTRKLISNNDDVANNLELKIFNDSTFLAVLENKFYEKKSQNFQSIFHFHKITQDLSISPFLDSLKNTNIQNYWLSKNEAVSGGLVYLQGTKDSGYFQFNEKGQLRQINLKPEIGESVKDVLNNIDTDIWIILEKSDENNKYDKYIHKVIYFDKSGTARTYSGFQAHEFNDYHLLDKGKILLLDARVLLKLEREHTDPSGVFLINSDSTHVKQLFSQEQVDNLLTSDDGNFFIVSSKTREQAPENILAIDRNGQITDSIGTFPLTRILFSTFGLEKDIDHNALWAITSEGQLYYITLHNSKIYPASIPKGRQVVIPGGNGKALLFDEHANFPKALIVFDGKKIHQQAIANPDNRFIKNYPIADGKHWVAVTRNDIAHIVDSNDYALNKSTDSFHLNDIIGIHSQNALDRIWVTTFQGAFLLIHTSKILERFSITPRFINIYVNPEIVHTGITAQNIQVNLFADGEKIGTGEVVERTNMGTQISIPFNFMDNAPSIWNKNISITISFSGFNNSDGTLRIRDIRFSIPFYETPQFYTILVFLAIVVAIVLLQLFREKIPIVYKYSAIAPWLLGLATTLYKDSLTKLVSDNLDWGLLGILILSSLTCLTLLCLFFPNILKSVGDQFPFDLLSAGLFKIPAFKGKFFKKYLDLLEERIRSEKGIAIDSREAYVPIPANFSENGQERTVLKPANAIASLFGRNEKGIRIAIIAPGGQGKSALLREFLYQYIQLFRKNPALPVPVYINGSNNGIEDFEFLLKDHLFQYLVPTDFSTQHKKIKTGYYLFIIDDINETYGSKQFLKNFEGIKRDYVKTPFVISLRPHEADVSLVTSIKNCRLAYPLKISDREITTFEAAYLPDGETLPPSLRNICRTNDGFYQPILVRLAILAYKASVNNITQLYEAAIRHLLEKTDPKNGYKYYEAAMAKICREAYGKKGEREITYHPDRGELITLLEKSSLLIKTDRENIFGNHSKSYRFLHDSIQTYLAAVGYLFEDADPQSLFYYFATDPMFIKDTSDFLFENGAELFQLAVLVFEDYGKGVKGVLINSLKEWAGKYELDLSARDVLNAIPPSRQKKLKRISGYQSPREIILFTVNELEYSLPLIAAFYYRISQVIRKY